MGSVSLGNQQAAYFANFEQYQFAGVGNAVGVADVKHVPASVRIAKGGNILHAWLWSDTGAGRFALCGGHVVNSLKQFVAS